MSSGIIFICFDNWAVNFINAFAHGTINTLRKKTIIGKGPKCLTVHYFLLCFQAIIHPDTGKKVLMPFRMSGLFVQKKLIILTLLLYHTFSEQKIMTSNFSSLFLQDMYLLEQ